MGRKALIIIFVFLILGLILFLLVIYKDKIFGANAATHTPIINPGGIYNPPSNGGYCSINASFPLQFHSKGRQVGEVQKYVVARNANALPLYGVDCDWGSETQEAVLTVLGTSSISQTQYTALGLS